MEIHPLGVKLLHADGLTGWQAKWS